MAEHKPYNWIDRTYSVHPSWGPPSDAEKCFYGFCSRIRVCSALITKFIMRMGWYLPLTLAAMVALIILTVDSSYFPKENDKRLQMAVGFGAAVAAYCQYIRSKAEGRVNKLKEHADAFFSGDLFEIYNEMIYRYPNSVFMQLDADCRRHLGIPAVESDKEADTAKQWSVLNKESMSEIRSIWLTVLPSYTTAHSGTPITSPLFHPAFLQGSEEEKKLDRLLAHFDVLGRLYKSKMIDLVHAYDLYGMQFSTMMGKDVLAEYFRVIDGAWDGNETDRPKYIPYLRFRILIADMQRLENIIKAARRRIKTLFKLGLWRMLHQ